jgi:hypothetical protein
LSPKSFADQLVAESGESVAGVAALGPRLGATVGGDDGGPLL